LNAILTVLHVVLECAWGWESGELSPGRGVRVRSVASLEMAAGLPGLSGPEGGARDVARRRGMDHSRPAKRFIFKRFTSDHFDFRCSRRGAMSIGSAVSAQKHTEIVFKGTESSCYPLLRVGAEGIVSSTSRRPN
jgi:hypothetical protein